MTKLSKLSVKHSVNCQTFFCRYNGDYDPYERPEAHMGFVMDGEAVDEYGRPIDHYGQPMVDPYSQQQYMNGNMDRDYEGYSGYDYR